MAFIVSKYTFYFSKRKFRIYVPKILNDKKILQNLNNKNQEYTFVIVLDNCKLHNQSINFIWREVTQAPSVK